ncbi:hypothetical protein [Spirillospora sp. NPDC029432]|uniref:hypothetical protein n=1 Tax=Spirillospora sp. NPDC029432 TaxID=3154599 RepID=UPI0034546629
MGVRPARRLAAAAALLAMALPAMVLAGCSDDPTETSKEPAVGTGGNVGNVTVRDLFVLAGPSGQSVPAGGSAPVYLTLINDPETVETAGPGGSPDPQRGSDALVGVSSPAAGSGEVLGGAVQAPAGRNVTVGPRATVVLKDLKQQLVPGENVQVSLRFRQAGSGTFNVPIQGREGDLASYSPAPAE